MEKYSLAGMWQVRLQDGSRWEAQLPGTLDENRIGYPDTGKNEWHPEAKIGKDDETEGQSTVIATRFTRKYTYEGEAAFTRRADWEPQPGKRAFFMAERARSLQLFVEGTKAPCTQPGTLSTPWSFEVTGLLKKGSELTVLSDNSYPGLPHDDIVYSSAATDETQTNWNGLLGELCLYDTENIFLSEVTVLPEDGGLTVRVVIDAGNGQAAVCSPVEQLVSDRKMRLTLESDALAKTWSEEINVEPCGRTEKIIRGLGTAEHVCRWDLEEGNLYELKATLEADFCTQKTVLFGIRSFGDNGNGRLALNGRTIFLRSEANCGEFPETGHPPMTVPEWTDVLERYRSYGVNCVRFHSHCPPEAAFTAADRIGMLIQPELSCWNPENAFETEESFRYYKTELEQIIRQLGNHPSFVMLTFGNELQTKETGWARMKEMLKMAHQLDATRLYANSSNYFYGQKGCDPESDFYTSSDFCGEMIRGASAGMAGHINRQYPNARTDYSQTMKKLRETYQKPVFSFEVGQFEVLPDFSELEKFHGISLPANLERVRKRAEQTGILNQWDKYVEASGALSQLCYREEIEAVMRTEELSGISLLGLQDFPGQGTALVGMMDSHLEPKPYAFAAPEAFRAFFTDQLPLVLLERYTYEAGETLRAQVKIANYGKSELKGETRWTLTDDSGLCIKSGLLPFVCCRAGGLTTVGELETSLDISDKAACLTLSAELGEAKNSWKIWVYPAQNPVCPESVYETRHFDEKVKSVLDAGGCVYLAPDSTVDQLPASVQAQFSTDFWSVGTFPQQSGCMGQLIDAKHPLFSNFPTKSHTDWQWWAMANQRAFILPGPAEAIVTEMDSYAFMRPMAQLLEGRCGSGKILISSMGLHQLQQYPEARALLGAVYRYMASEDFSPEQVLEEEFVNALVR